MSCSYVCGLRAVSQSGEAGDANKTQPKLLGSFQGLLNCETLIFKHKHWDLQSSSFLNVNIFTFLNFILQYLFKVLAPVSSSWLMNQHHRCFVPDCLVFVRLLLLYHIFLLSQKNPQISSVLHGSVSVKADWKPPTYTNTCALPPSFPSLSVQMVWKGTKHAATDLTGYSRFGLMFHSVWKGFNRNACVHLTCLSALDDDTLEVPIVIWKRSGY